MMLDTKKILANNIATLLKRYSYISRLDLAKLMKVADGTLGRMKYGTGNPTIEVLEDVARYCGIEVWQLLVPDGPTLKAPPAPESVAGQLSAQGCQISEQLAELESKGMATAELYQALAAFLTFAGAALSAPQQPAGHEATPESPSPLPASVASAISGNLMSDEELRALTTTEQFVKKTNNAG